MDDSKRSKSYPEGLSELKDREYREKLETHREVLQEFKEKDHRRAETLAIMGSNSSLDAPIRLTWYQQCCELFVRWGNYIMERNEEVMREDFRIRQKSYAGFYYFIKWFARSVFLTFFSILGSIGGKEIGCAIKDHRTCSITALDLAGNSPHIVASLLGSLCGILFGQWIGRFLWDHITRNIMRCLRKLEKRADKTKLWLLITSIFIYIIGSIMFSIIFWLFVKIHGVKDNILGAIVGAIVGALCAGIAYKKSHKCMSGQQTPSITMQTEIVIPPELEL